MAPKIVYIGLFLTEESRKKLLALFPPKHPKVTADHVTLAFKPSEETLKLVEPYFGMKVRLHLTNYAHDDKGQAVAVRKESLPYVENDLPHITISCAEDTNPVYSNELLKNHQKSCHVLPLPELVLESIVDTWPRQKKEPEKIGTVIDRVLDTLKGK